MFLIFAGEKYYASGGGYDFIKCEEDKAKAIREAKSIIGKKAVTRHSDWDDALAYEIQWSQVVDGNTGDIIKKFGIEPYGYKSVAIEIR